MALMLAACGRATGPERRHLVGVELAREALALQRLEPKRKELLLRAKEELVAALAKTPRLAGAGTTLAGVFIALGERAAAEKLLKPDGADDDGPVQEVQARVALRALLLASGQRWDETVELAGAEPGLAMLVTIARRYQTAWDVAADCPRAPAGDTPRVSAPEAGGAQTPVEKLSAQRDAWCGGRLEAAALLEALSGEAPALPRLALSHHRLRAAALSSLNRWAEALTGLDVAVAAASALLKEAQATATAAPSSEKDGTPQTAPKLLLQVAQPMHPLLAALDLDRAVANAWLGRIDEARRLVAGALAGREDPRATALGRALTP